MPASRGSSRSRGQTLVSCTAGGFLTIWATREAQEYWSGEPIPSPGNLPSPGIEPVSPALQAESLPVELPGKPMYVLHCVCSFFCWWIASTFWLSWIMLLWAWLYKYLFEHLLLIILGVYPEVELLHHLAITFLKFWGKTAMLSTTVEQLQSLHECANVQFFPYLHPLLQLQFLFPWFFFFLIIVILMDIKLYFILAVL